MPRSAGEPEQGQLLIRGSLLRVTNAVLGAAIGFFMMPFLVVHLGDHDYGLWIIVGTLTGSLYLLDLGFAASITRFVALALGTNDIPRMSRMVSTTLVIYSALAVVVLLVTVLVAMLAGQWSGAGTDQETLERLILVSGASLALGFPFKAFAGILQARLRYDVLSVINLLRTVFAAAAVVVLVSGGSGVLALAYVGLVTGLAGDLLFLREARRQVPALRLSLSMFDRTVVRELTAFSLWSFLIQLAGQVQGRVDALVVAGIQSASAVTRFTVGARLAEIPNGLLYQATNVIQPLLTGLYARGQSSRMREALGFFTRLNVILGFFVSGMLIILGRPFIEAWMGAQFLVAYPVLVALTISKCASFTLNPLDNSLYAVGNIKVLALANVVDAFFNLALSIYLGLRLGIVGVAIGTLVPTMFRRIFLARYAVALLEWPLAGFAACYLRPALLATGLILGIHATAEIGGVQPAGYLQIIGYAAAAALVYFPPMFALGLGEPERRIVVREARNAIRSVVA